MTNTECIETLETRIQNWIEEQTRIAKEIQYELNAIEREERDIDFGKIRKLAYEKEGKADGIEELKKKIEFMLQTMDQQGLEQAYKILQRIWIRHGTQQ